MSESETQAEILMLSRGNTRLFRNHVGKGATGQEVRVTVGQTVRIEPGMIVLRNARRATFGLCPGSSDLIGWQSVMITPHMVGSTVAVFSAIECKSDTCRASSGQLNFCDVVRQAGGRAGIAKSADQAKVILGKSE